MPVMMSRVGRNNKYTTLEAHSKQHCQESAIHAEYILYIRGKGLSLQHLHLQQMLSTCIGTTYSAVCYQTMYSVYNISLV
jgi:hypothetical protein